MTKTSVCVNNLNNCFTKLITIIMCIIIKAISVRLLHYLSELALSSSALLSFSEGLVAPVQGSQTQRIKQTTTRHNHSGLVSRSS